MFLDLKTALGKKRSDEKSAPLQPLTTMQRHHVGRLIDEYGDDYEVRSATLGDIYQFWFSVSLLIKLLALQSMFRDTKLNKMQHSVATLKNLCKRYHTCQGKNPLIKKEHGKK